ncbi:EpsG family protein [Vibrio parahaemolyticus]|nr:EpsG family protein [Vibrio parahaemolyticus]
MTFELIYYLFLFFVGFALCFVKIKNETVYNFSAFFLLLGFSFVTRYSGFDLDMITYAHALDINSWDVYYLKEPVYWITSRYVHDLTNSSELTFIFYDVIAFVLIIKARKNMRLPQYFIFLYFLFFPSILGINNVLRQFLSCCIFLYLISLFFVEGGLIKKTIVSIIAVLTHNVAALFLPVYYLLNRSNQISIRGVFMCIIIIGLLPIALSTKSNADTGTLGVGVYLVVLSAVTLFVAFSNKLSMDGLTAKFFYYSVYLLSLTSVSAVLMGSAQSKRVGMYSLVISLIPLTMSVEKCFRQRNLVRGFVYVFLLLPTILFPSSLMFLMTE